AKDIALHSEAFAIGLNQALRSQFGGPVERGLKREGARLGRGENLWLAVDRSGCGKDNTFTTLLAHRLQHVPGCDGVLVEIFAGMIGTEADVGVGGEVDDQFRVFHRLRQGLSVEHVALLEREIPMAPCVIQETPLAGGHVIETYYLVPY